MSEAQGKAPKEESVGHGSGRAKDWLHQEESALLLPGLISPVCHQHLDGEVGQKNQEGAGCIVFEGGECREPILGAKG